MLQLHKKIHSSIINQLRKRNLQLAWLPLLSPQLTDPATETFQSARSVYLLFIFIIVVVLIIIVNYYSEPERIIPFFVENNSAAVIR